MKKIIPLLFFLLTASALLASDAVPAAMTAAFTAAQGTPAKVAPAAIAGADNWTIRTDVYTDAQGTGFQVVATLKIGSLAFNLVQQSGPETSRQNMPTLAQFKAQLVASLQNQFQAALAKGISQGGIVLPGSVASQSKLQGIFVLMGQVSPTPANITLIDINGAPHSVSYMTAYNDLVGYGSQVYALTAGLSTATANVQSATAFDGLSP